MCPVASRLVSGPVISVEVVTHRTQMRRFVDVPYLLFGDDPRWARPVRAYESWRFDERRHPFFRTGTAAYFLARVQGRPAGRITAQFAAPGQTDGWFGFLAAPDDVEVTSALLDAAQEWLDGEGATSMTGPVSWSGDEEFGVPVGGVEAPGVTGRPWHPGYYADHLRRLGLHGGEIRHTYRIAAHPHPIEPGADDGSPRGPGVDARGRSDHEPDDERGDLSAPAGRFRDPRLILGDIAAVPDVTDTLAGVSLRSAWRQARRAARLGFTTAVCVRCDGDPAVLVPRLVDAAATAGYREVVVPWAPPGTAPETSHQVFTRRW